MYGEARLDIPVSGHIGPSSYGGLSDELAMITGRVAAMTLPDQDVPITVTLNDGSQVFIGLDEHGRIELSDEFGSIELSGSVATA